MKFLCVKCDEPLKLTETSGPDDSGSLAVVYLCQKCGHQTAMLTNAHETQLITSLGVRIGPDGKAASCPFSKMFQNPTAPPTSEKSEFTWASEALARLQKIPDFVRPMARSGIEKFAKEAGIMHIDEQLMDRYSKTSIG